MREGKAETCEEKVMIEDAHTFCSGEEMKIILPKCLLETNHIHTETLFVDGDGIIQT